MAGITAIVSDWNFNSEIVLDDREGIVLKETKNVGGIEGLCVITPAVHGDARG